MPTAHTPTIAASRALRKIGADLKRARLARRLPMDVIAERAFISRNTLTKVEKGDPAVGFGIYASVMHALGVMNKLPNLIDDKLGLDLIDEQLPKRVRLK